MPFEVFVLFVAMALTIGIIGIILGLKKIDGAPFIIVFAGILFFSQIVLTNELVMGYQPVNETQVTSTKTTRMDQQSQTGLVDMCSGTGCSVIRGEYVKASSVLLNKEIDCIDLTLRKVGSPPVNTLVQIGVWNSSVTGNRNPDFSFGSLNTTSLTTSTAWYAFCLPTGQDYLIKLNDVIGVRYNAGNSTNAVRSAIDDNNPFDSTFSTHRAMSVSGGTWSESTARDHTMILTLGTNQVLTSITNSEIKYAFDDYDSWAYMVFLSALFIFIGVMFQWKK